MSGQFREVDVPERARMSRAALLAGLLLVTLVVSAISFVGFGIGYGLVTLACSDPAETACDLGALSAGIRLAVFGPALVTLVTVVVSIVLLVRKRPALWVAAAGLVLSIVLFAVGTALVNGAAPGGTLF